MVIPAERRLSFVALGGAVGALLTSLIYLLSLGRKRALNIAETITKDLRMKVQIISEQNTVLEQNKKAMLNLLEDIKVEKENAEYNVQELRKFRLAVDSTSDHVVITDADGYILYANAAAERITGYARGEMIGKRPSMWGGSMPKAYHEDFWETIKIKKQPFEGEVNNKRKNGEHYIAWVSIAPVTDVQGNLLFFVAIERDITKEREIDRSKSEFVSLAAHQLRSPLSTVNWYSEMLLAGDVKKLTKAQGAYVQEIFNANQRMIELVDALLNVSRIELGSFAVEPEPTDVPEIMNSILSELSAQVRGKQLNIKKDIDRRLTHIHTDPKLLRIIFQNLINNAVKYTPARGTITITTALEGKTMRASVADTGYGIPADVQSRIFTKFFRADNAREKEAIGTGLGLYIVKSILDKIGGEVWFESKEQQGTTFFFIWPLEIGRVEKSGFPLAAKKPWRTSGGE